MRKSLVSTIIPVYNRPALVMEAVESVLAQTYRPIEIIVVDDGSTDDTAAAVEQISVSHPEITLLRQPNSGPGPARQKGLDAAQGEFIQFLDSDDLLVRDKFEKQTAKLRQHLECGACYGWTVRYPLGAAISTTPVKWTAMKFETMFPSFLADRWWDTSTPLYRGDLVRGNGAWLDLLQEEDWEFDCRLASKGVKLTMVESVVSETRVSQPQSLSYAASVHPVLLRDRCAVRGKILQHAITARIERTEPHMQRFLDSSFLVARQAALAGLEMESAILMRQLNDFDKDFKRGAYAHLGSLFGFRRTTVFAEATRSILRKFSRGGKEL